MKQVTTTNTTIEIDSGGLYFQHHNDFGVLTVEDKDNDESNTIVKISIKRNELEYLLRRLQEELE